MTTTRRNEASSQESRSAAHRRRRIVAAAAGSAGRGSRPPKAKPSIADAALPVTTLMGTGKGGKKPANQPADETVDEAVTEQRDLLAEFEKVANELNTILGNLEGSTLVKRLRPPRASNTTSPARSTR